MSRDCRVRWMSFVILNWLIIIRPQFVEFIKVMELSINGLLDDIYNIGQKRLQSQKSYSKSRQI